MTTSNFTDYLRRNREFAATDAKTRVPEIPFVPFKQLYLITCIDPRVASSARDTWPAAAGTATKRPAWPCSTRQ